MLKQVTLWIKNFRTTIAGGLTLIASITTFIAHWAASGSIPDAAHWEALGVGITAGAGLLAAADAKTTAKVVDKVKADVSELQEQSSPLPTPLPPPAEAPR